MNNAALLFGVAFSVGIIIGLLGSPQNDPGALIEEPQNSSISEVHVADKSRSQNKILSLRIETLPTSGLRYSEVEQILKSASDVELAECIEQLSLRFWQHNPHAGYFLARSAQRVFGADRSDGMASGIAFLDRRKLAGPPFVVLRGFLEGCFLASLPSPPIVSQVIATHGREQTFIILEEYLTVGSEDTLPEIDRLAGELVGQNEDIRSDSSAMRRVHSLAIRIWMLRGAEGLRDFDAVAEERESVRNGLESLAAVNPSKAFEIARALISRSPEIAGDIFPFSTLGLAKLHELELAVSVTDREKFWSSVRRAFQASSPVLLRRFFEEVSVDSIFRDAVYGFVSDAISNSCGDAIRWLGSLDAAERGNILDTSARRHFWDDAREAREFLSARLDLGNVTDEAILRPLRVVARVDWNKALDYAKLLPDSLRDNATKQVYGVLASEAAIQSPEEFVHILEDAPSAVRPEMLHSVARRANDLGSVDVMAIGEKLTADDRATFFDSILRAIRNKADPPEQPTTSAVPLETLRSIANQLLSNGFKPTYGDGLANVAMTLAERDPLLGLTVLENFPSGKQREAFLVPLVEKWAQLDPVAACDWAEALPAGNERDRVVSSIAVSAPSELQTALRSAQTISNRDLRIKTLQTVANVWLRADPAHFRASLAALGFSAADQHAIQATQMK